MDAILILLYLLIVVLTIGIVALWFRLFMVREHVKRLKKIILHLEGEQDQDPGDEPEVIGRND